MSIPAPISSSPTCWPPGVPRADLDACNLGKDVVTAIGHLAQLFKGFVQVAEPSGMPYRRRQSTKEELIYGGHCPSVSNVDSIMYH